MVTSKAEPVVSRYAAFALLLLLLGWSVWVITSVQPSQPSAADAPPASFSALRARKHIEAIATQARPSGTVAHQQAQRYIIDSLSALGIKAELQVRSVSSTRWGLPFDSATAENIVAELPGTANEKTILLVCHYDSVPNSPGASDNGSGIAVLLETARALKSAPPLKNSIRLLFTDAEESGALGAHAYAAEASNLAGIGLVANFDARGNRGPAALFDTSAQNGFLIRELDRAVVAPAASSAVYEVARWLGHATDFRPFKEAGLPGFNFAFSEGITHYHTPIDNIANLNLGSLQQQGDNALSIARHFGNLAGGSWQQEDVIFFNKIGGGLIIYRKRYVLPILAFIAVIFLFTLWRLRALINAGQIALSFFAVTGIALLSGALVTGLHRLIRYSHAAYQVMHRSDSYNAGYYRLAYVALSLTIFLFLYQLVRRRIALINFALGCAVLWQILLIAASLWAPGTSYICAWPLAAFLLAVNSLPWGKRWAMIVITAAALLSIFLIAPLPYMIFVALQLSRAGMAAAAVIMLAGILVMAIDPILLQLRWRMTAAAGLTAIILLALGSFTAGFSSERPLPTSLAYAYDTANGKTYWLSEDRRLNEYSAQYIKEDAQFETAPEFFPDESVRIRRGAAPLFAPLRGPVVTLLDDKTENGVRRLRLQISSAREASWLYLFLASPHTVVHTTIDGVPVKGDKIYRQADGWGFRHLNLPAQGIEWLIEVKASGEPIDIIVVDQSFGLTELGSAVKALPAHMMAARSWIADSILVRAAYRF